MTFLARIATMAPNDTASAATPMARLPPITGKTEVAAKDHGIVDGIVASRGAVQGPFTMFLHAPELAGRLAHLGAYVRFEGSLDMRARVLAAMTVAREFEAVYVWGAQTGAARRLGVPEATIAAIRDNRARHPGRRRRDRRFHPAVAAPAPGRRRRFKRDAGPLRQ